MKFKILKYFFKIFLFPMCSDKYDVLALNNNEEIYISFL